MLNKDNPFEHHQRTSYPKSPFCHQRAQNCHSKDYTYQIYISNIYIVAHVPALGTGGVNKTDEFSVKYQGGGGGHFQSIIYVADFGPLNRAY